MTNVDTKKLQGLIDAHKRFQKVIESELTVINNAGNLISRVRASHSESYVLNAANAAYSCVDRAKTSSSTLKDHLTKKKTGLQSTLEIYLDAEREAKNLSKNTDILFEAGDFAYKAGKEVLGGAGTIGSTIKGVFNIAEFFGNIKEASPGTIASFAKDLYGLGTDLFDSREAIAALVKAKGNLGKLKTEWFEKLTGFGDFWDASSFGSLSAKGSSIEQFGENWWSITKSNIDDYKIFGENAKMGSALAKWGAVALSVLTNAFSNYDEFKDENGNVGNWTRFVSETVLETAVDIAMDAAIGAAVGALAGCLVAAGVITAAPAIVVAAISGIVALSINVLCEKLTGKGFSELVSDAILDSIEYVGKKISEATDVVKDFCGRLANARSRQGEIDAIWAEADDRIAQAILETERSVSETLGGLSTVGTGVLSAQGVALAGVDCVMPYGQTLAVTGAAANYGSPVNGVNFARLIVGLSAVRPAAFVHEPLVGISSIITEAAPLISATPAPSYSAFKNVFENFAGPGSLLGNTTSGISPRLAFLQNLQELSVIVERINALKRSLYGPAFAPLGLVIQKSFSGQFESKNAVDSSTQAYYLDIFGIDPGEIWQDHLLGYEGSGKYSANLDLFTGEVGASGEASLEGYLAKREIKGESGLLSGSLTGAVGTAGVSAEAEATIFKNGRYNPKLKFGAEAEAKGASAAAAGRIGTDDINGHAELEGVLGYAKASAGCALSVDNVKLQAEVGAAVFKGEGKAGFTILGLNVDITGEVEAISAGAKAGFDVSPTSIEVGGKVSLLAGLGLKLKISW